MKKVKDIVFGSLNISLSIIVLFASFMVLVPKVEASSKEPNTIAEYRQELNNLKAKKKRIENEKKLTQQEINEKNLAINKAHQNIEESEAKIEEAKIEIEASQTEILKYEEKTKELMKYNQVVKGENAYLNFVNDASSLTELIMRLDAINLIAEYNKDQLNTLEDLINELEKKQVDLKNYEKQLSKDIDSFTARIDELDSSLLAFDDDRMDLEEEIKAIEEKIEMYKNAGCGENEALDVCLAKGGTNKTFMKPVTKGYITSLFGYRNVSGQSSNHSGIDIGVAEGTTVYSMINGVVAFTVKKASCGGNKVYIEGIVNGQKYTVVFLHLLSINVKAGDVVTTQTVVGKSGGRSTATRYGGYDRCTTGAHLHVSVSKGYWKNDATYRANLINPPGFPKTKGAWFYSRTQWFD